MWNSLCCSGKWIADYRTPKQGKKEIGSDKWKAFDQKKSEQITKQIYKTKDCINLFGLVHLRAKFKVRWCHAQWKSRQRYLSKHEGKGQNPKNRQGHTQGEIIRETAKARGTLGTYSSKSKVLFVLLKPGVDYW